MEDVKYNIFNYFYKIKSQHDDAFYIEMSTLKLKPFIKQLKTDFKEYKKNNQTNYKQIYEIIEMNDIEITLLDSCYGSQKFADNIYTKLILKHTNIFMINNLR